MTLTLVTAPTAEPLTLEEAKAQCRITVTDEDDLIGALIEAARARVEDVTSRQLMTATWRLTLDGWPCDGVIELPRPPLQSVSSITYVDTAGATQTWATSEYVVSAPGGDRAARGLVRLAANKTFPSVLGQPDVITVTFVAGYGGSTSVPAPIKQAMKLLIGTWYENREDEIVDRGITSVPALSAGARRILAPYKCYGRAA